MTRRKLRSRGIRQELQDDTIPFLRAMNGQLTDFASSRFVQDCCRNPYQGPRKILVAME
jgi:hypothetical protein